MGYQGQSFFPYRTDGYVRTGRHSYLYLCRYGQGDDRICRQGGGRPGGTLYGTIRYDVPQNPEVAIAPFIEAAKVTRSLGMGLNAGHDLSLVNLKYMHTHIPWLDEVSIGHALISDALYMGLKQTIEEYKNCLRS